VILRKLILLYAKPRVKWYGIAASCCTLYSNFSIVTCLPYWPLLTPNLTCSDTGDAVRFVNSFIYDPTSRHYNFFYNVLWPSHVASLSGSSDLLWSGPLISFDLLLWSASLVASLTSFFDLSFYCRNLPCSVYFPGLVREHLVQGLSFIFNSALASVASESNNSVSVVAGKRYLCRCLGIPSRLLSMLTCLSDVTCILEAVA
jgi:hypothetical protein